MGIGASKCMIFSKAQPIIYMVLSCCALVVLSQMQMRLF